MTKCGNFACPNKVPAENILKSKTIKFKVTKENGCEKLENRHPVAFCDGTPNSASECCKKFEKFQQRVKNVNEGGPFGTPMRTLVDLLRSMVDHPKLFNFDRVNINKALKEFDYEISKVSSPIVERLPEKRMVKVSDGNPSDGNYQQKNEEPEET